jgi:hypothetical protein
MPSLALTAFLLGPAPARAADPLTGQILAYSERQQTAAAKGEPVEAWPARTGSQAGAILFAADIVVRNDSSNSLHDAELVFKAASPPAIERFSLGNQAQTNRLFLVALPPGDYETSLELTLPDRAKSTQVLGRFENFTVKTGQVAVLGSVDFAVRMDDENVEVSDPKYDAKPETLAKLLKDAVTKADATRPAWSAPLKSAFNSLESEQAKANPK